MIKLFEEFVLEKLILEASQKDIMRINDIVKKANGDLGKAKSLATQMANAIKDKSKAYDRAKAAESILGVESDVYLAFINRATELGVDIEGNKKKETVLPGSKRPNPKTSVRTSSVRGGFPILPCGSLNLQTGGNKYFNIFDKWQIGSTLEVWEDLSEVGPSGKSGKYKIVITSGSSPICGIGQTANFIHDQNHRDLFYGKMVDYIEAEFASQLIPLYGKSFPSYVYK